MNLYPVISKPLYAQTKGTDSNIKKSKLPAQKKSHRNGRLARNGIGNRRVKTEKYPVLHEMGVDINVYIMVPGMFVFSSVYDPNGLDKSIADMIMQGRQESIYTDDKTENMAMLVEELDAEQKLNADKKHAKKVHHLAKWMSELQEYEKQRQHIDSISAKLDTFIELIKAYDYVQHGESVDKENAQILSSDYKNAFSKAKAFAQARAENLEQLVAELEQYFDTKCWVQEIKDQEKHQMDILQTKQRMRAELAAQDYFKAGRMIDVKNARALYEKSRHVSNKDQDSYYIFGMPDDVTNIAAQCLDKTLSRRRINAIVDQFVHSRIK